MKAGGKRLLGRGRVLQPLGGGRWAVEVRGQWSVRGTFGASDMRKRAKPVRMRCAALRCYCKIQSGG